MGALLHTKCLPSCLLAGLDCAKASLPDIGVEVSCQSSGRTCLALPLLGCLGREGTTYVQEVSLFLCDVGAVVLYTSGSSVLTSVPACLLACLLTCLPTSKPWCSSWTSISSLCRSGRMNSWVCRSQARPALPTTANPIQCLYVHIWMPGRQPSDGKTSGSISSCSWLQPPIITSRNLEGISFSGS